jgi:UDP-N-acetylglucosamine acyltransferase
MSKAIDVGVLQRQSPVHYPFIVVDRILESDDAGRVVAIKNVTGAEEFFQGHFPGAPVMPGVLLMESLAQTAGIWLLSGAHDPGAVEVQLVGIDNAKFRRPVIPGDQLRLEVGLVRHHRALWRFRGVVKVGEQRAAEAELLLQVVPISGPWVDPTARVDARAILGQRVRVGAYTVIGPQVEVGDDSRIDHHVTLSGPLKMGRKNRVFPYASIGLEPQDLKYQGEDSELLIGDENTFREFVTIHRGTRLGGNVTRIGSGNLFMAYTHVAHDCAVGNHTIFANAASLAGHVEVQDYATLGGFSGVVQFCRIGAYAYIGGHTLIAQDVAPFSKVAGNPACYFGINSVGLMRRGFGRESRQALRRAFATLLSGSLNTSQALARLDQEVEATPEVQELVAFVRASKRGVLFRRARRRPVDGDGTAENDE